MTNLDHLNVISTICEVGSFHLASEKLNKARSAVSYSVKQVEEYYQIKIFDRSKYRPELTPEGKALLIKIRQLLQQAQAFENYIAELKGENEAEIRLAISSVFSTEWLTKLLKSLGHNYPSTTVHLDFEVASGERMLLADKADMAVYAAPLRNTSLDYKKIDNLEVPLLISSDLLDQAPNDVSRGDLVRYPQIVTKSSDQKAPDTGLLEGAHKWYVSDLHAKRDLISAGLGWGRIPRHMVENEINNGHLVELKTLGEISLPVCVVRRSIQHAGPVCQHIWSFFEEVT